MAQGAPQPEQQQQQQTNNYTYNKYKSGLLLGAILARCIQMIPCAIRKRSQHLSSFGIWKKEHTSPCATYTTQLESRPTGERKSRTSFTYLLLVFLQVTEKSHGVRRECLESKSWGYQHRKKRLQLSGLIETFEPSYFVTLYTHSIRAFWIWRSSSAVWKYFFIRHWIL